MKMDHNAIEAARSGRYNIPMTDYERNLIAAVKRRLACASDMRTADIFQIVRTVFVVMAFINAKQKDRDERNKQALMDSLKRAGWPDFI